MNPHKKLILLLGLWGGIFVSAFSASALAGNVSLTTYYPAPEATFDRLRLIPQNQLVPPPPRPPNLPCDSGTLTVVNPLGTIWFCRDDNSGQMTGDWEVLVGVWEEQNNAVFSREANNDPDIHVGIGTNQPAFRLTLEEDGGIYARASPGNTNPDDIVVPASNNAQLIWYPRNAAFRIGLVNSNPFPNVQIGLNSVSFGPNSQALGSGSVVAGGPKNTVAIQGSLSSVFSSGNSTATGSYVSIIGGSDNRATATANYARITGTLNTATADYTTIGGTCNAATAVGAVVAGGLENNVTVGQGGIIPCVPNQNVGRYSTIVAGNGNDAQGNHSVIGGGERNRTTGQYSTIASGENFVNDGIGSTIRGHGINTSISGSYATIAGGQGNARGNYSTIGTCTGNLSGQYSTAVGCSGLGQLTGQAGTIVGGHSFTGTLNSGAGIVNAGGEFNSSQASLSWAGGRNTQLDKTANNTFAWSYNPNLVDGTTLPANIFFTTPDIFTIGYSPPPRISNTRVGIRDTKPAGIFEINRNGFNDNYLTITSGKPFTAAGDILVINRNLNTGRVGIDNANPQFPLEIGNFAHVDAMGNYFPVLSSRELKENIKNLNTEAAYQILQDLRPVTFNYKIDPKEPCVGFIAEDVPEAVAEPGRKGLHAMGFTAVLTAVVQDHEKRLSEDDQALDNAFKELNQLKRQLQTR